MNAGYHQIEFNASTLASSVNLYSIVADDFSTGSGQDFAETKKMVIVKYPKKMVLLH